MKSTGLTAGTCDGGIFTFEKTTGQFLRTGRETALELSSNTPGITKECVSLCLGKGKETPFQSSHSVEIFSTDNKNKNGDVLNDIFVRR